MKKLLTFCGILAVVGAIGIGIHAADHIDAPAVTGDGTGIASDITDLYAFQSPSNPDNRVFVVNTNGLLSPDATANATFDTNVMIEINISNDGDLTEDLVIQVLFTEDQVITYGPLPPNDGEASSLMSTINLGGPTISTDITELGEEPNVGTNNGVSLFAGPREDPFFFDFGQFNAVLAGEASSFEDPGTDTFAGTNVMSVVVEVPNSQLGNAETLNVWATTNVQTN